MKLSLSQEKSALMSIGQIAEQSKLPASTIRYWERIGVMPPPARKSGQRRYTQESLERLAVLRLAQSCGFRLDEMRQLVNGFKLDVKPSQKWQELATRKQAEIDDQVARLQAMRRVVNRVVRCQCLDWKQCGREAYAALCVASE